MIDMRADNVYNYILIKKYVFLLFVLVSCTGANKKEVHTDKFSDVINRLLYKESSGNHYFNGKVTVSHAGAVGKWQITEPVLIDYNTFTGSRYTMRDLRNRWKNQRVGIWQIRRAFREFDHLEPYEQYVYAINTYNMGFGNSYKNKIYWKYVKYICPEDYTKFMQNYRITKWGTQVIQVVKK